ncbi:MAG: hydroxyacid dehydrogenase, partial [Burkholderiaceae bacterium]|nr:hydroxyacid dehydrogenase [Burkholderiaceae bacterium]
MNHSEFISYCQSVLGDAYVLVEPKDQVPYLSDWRNRYHGKALAVLLPK